MAEALLDAPEVQEAPVETVTPTPVENIMAVTETLRRNYDKVFEDGTLISLHLSIWGMAAQLNEDDLSIEKQPDIFKLGKKMLIKQEIFNKFKQIEGRARGFLYRSAFKFPISEAHFVPNKKLNEVDLRLLELQKEFNALAEDFFTKYETHKEEFLAAHETHRSKLEPFYPTLEQIKKKFAFDWTQFRISMPKEFGEYDLNAKMAEERVVTEAEKKAQEELKVKAAKQAEMLHDFVRDAGELVRKKVLESCQTIAEKISRKEIINKANVNTLLRQVNDFDSLNFLDDAQVAERLSFLKGLLTDGTQDFKENPASIATLETALNSVIAETKKISDVDSLSGKYFRSIEVDD